MWTGEPVAITRAEIKLALSGLISVGLFRVDDLAWAALCQMFCRFGFVLEMIGQSGSWKTLTGWPLSTVVLESLRPSKSRLLNASSTDVSLSASIAVIGWSKLRYSVLIRCPRFSRILPTFSRILPRSVVLNRMARPPSGASRNF